MRGGVSMEGGTGAERSEGGRGGRRCGRSWVSYCAVVDVLRAGEHRQRAALGRVEVRPSSLSTFQLRDGHQVDLCLFVPLLHTVRATRLRKRPWVLKSKTGVKTSSTRRKKRRKGTTAIISLPAREGTSAQRASPVSTALPRTTPREEDGSVNLAVSLAKCRTLG